MHPRSGPFRKRQHAADGFDFGDHGARRQVGQRIDATFFLHTFLPTSQNRRVFRVHDGTNTQWRELFKPFQEGAVTGGGQVAEGVADKRLEAGHAGVNQLFKMADGVVTQQPMNTEIHVGRFRRLQLQIQGLDRAGRRVGVGHLEYGGYATTDCRSGAGLPGFLVRVTRVTEMHMAVDSAGQQVHAVGLQHFACRRHQVIVTDSNDNFSVDGNRSLDYLMVGHNARTAYDQIYLTHDFPPRAEPIRHLLADRLL